MRLPVAAALALLLVAARAGATSQSGSLDGAAGHVTGTMTAGFFAGDGHLLTNVTASSSASHVNLSLVGDGTAGAPLGVRSSSVAVLGSAGFVLNQQLDGSSVTKQGNAFNGASQLVQMTAANKLPAVDGSLLTGVLSTAFTGGTVNNFTVFLSSLVVAGTLNVGAPIVGNSSVTASSFFGDGSHLTGLSATFTGGYVANTTTFGSSVTINSLSSANSFISKGPGLMLTSGSTSYLDSGAAGIGSNGSFGTSNCLSLYDGSGSPALTACNGNSLIVPSGSVIATNGADTTSGASLGSDNSGHANVNVNGPTGYILSRGSITASAFFGDGSGLVNLPCNLTGTNSITCPPGAGNSASGTAGFVGAGISNTVSGNYNGIVGGNTDNATGTSDFLGGGNSNTASGSGSAVIGGNNSGAPGDNAVVLGGTENSVSGTNSVVGGWNATATSANAFVWSGLGGGAQNDNGDNTFTVGASGGSFFEAGAVTANAGLNVAGTNLVFNFGTTNLGITWADGSTSTTAFSGGGGGGTFDGGTVSNETDFLSSVTFQSDTLTEGLATFNGGIAVENSTSFFGSTISIQGVPINGQGLNLMVGSTITAPSSYKYAFHLGNNLNLSIKYDEGSTIINATDDFGSGVSGDVLALSSNHQGVVIGGQGPMAASEGFELDVRDGMTVSGAFGIVYTTITNEGIETSGHVDANNGIFSNGGFSFSDSFNNSLMFYDNNNYDVDVATNLYVETTSTIGINAYIGDQLWIGTGFSPPTAATGGDVVAAGTLYGTGSWLQGEMRIENEFDDYTRITLGQLHGTGYLTSAAGGGGTGMPLLIQASTIAINAYNGTGLTEAIDLDAAGQAHMRLSRGDGFNNGYLAIIASGGGTTYSTFTASGLQLQNNIIFQSGVSNIGIHWADGTTSTTAASGGGGGSGITALTGDMTASGSGSVVATAAATQPNIKTLSGLTTISNPYTATSSMTNTSSGGILSKSSITASAFFGDGSHLTGLAATFTGGYVANVTTFGSSVTVNDSAAGGLLVRGDSVTANAFFGDGSHLAGLVSTGAFTTRASSGTNADLSAFLGAGAGLAVSTQTTHTSSVTVVNAVLQLTGAGGNLVSASSVTGSAFFGDASHLTGVSGATETVTAALTGVGTPANPLGINSSSVPVFQSGAYPPASGAAITALTAANVSAGTLGPSVVASSVGVNTISNAQLVSGVFARVTGLGAQSQALDLGTQQIHNVVDPTSAQDAATMNYVLNTSNGNDWKTACVYATTAGLATYVYNNGSSGVGATITGVSVGSLAIDGDNVIVGNRVLVKNETLTNAPNNGIYTVTAAGGVASVYVLTRTSDFNSTADIVAGDAVFITSGTVNITTSWVVTTTATVTVGTTPIAFAQFAGPGTYSASTGLTLTGTAFSISNTAVSAASYGSGTQVPNYTVNAQGQLTAAANTTISLTAANLQSGTYANVVVLSTNVASGALGTAVTISTINIVPGFNSASELVQLTGAGALPALSGAALTSLTAANVSAGTLGTGVVAQALALPQGSTVTTGGTVYLSSSSTSSQPLVIISSANNGTITVPFIAATLNGNSTTATTATNIAGGSNGSMHYQTASGVTAALSPGTTGYALQVAATGDPSWVAAVTSATNVVGGAANSLPYQSAANTTSMLPQGTGVLQENAGVPGWTTGPTQVLTLPGLTTISSAYTATSSMTNTSANGVLVISSVTAGALFGDGNHLTLSTVVVTQNGVSPTSYANGYFTNATGVEVTNVNSFAQHVFQNLSNGADASSDLILNTDLGGPTSYYLDVGQNSSRFLQAGQTVETSSSGFVVTSDADLILWAGMNGGLNGAQNERLLFGSSNTVTANLAAEILPASATGPGAFVSFSSFTVLGSSGVLVTSSVTAGAFYGDGSHLTGLSATFNGGTVANQTTFESTVTVQGNAFGVGGGTLVVVGGRLGLSTGTPSSRLDLGANDTLTNVWNASAVSGAMINFSETKNFTLTDSTSGTNAQSLYSALAGNYWWGSHFHMTGTGEWAYVAGLHGTSDLGVGMVLDDAVATSTGIRIFTASPNNNPNQNLLLFDAASNWQSLSAGGTQAQGLFNGNYILARTSGAATTVFKLPFDGGVIMGTSTARVGIDNAAPQAILHSGPGTDAPSQGAATAFLYASGNGNTDIVARDSTDHSEMLFRAGSGGGVFGTATNHAVSFYTNLNPRGVVDASGLWAFGTTTTLSTAAVHVAGAEQVDGALTLSGGQSINLSGAAGNFVGQSSITTTGAFFGDGSHLGGITASFSGGAVANATTFASSVTITASGGIAVSTISGIGSGLQITTSVALSQYITSTSSANFTIMQSTFIASFNGSTMTPCGQLYFVSSNSVTGSTATVASVTTVFSTYTLAANALSNVGDGVSVECTFVNGTVAPGSPVMLIRNPRNGANNSIGESTNAGALFFTRLRTTVTLEGVKYGLAIGDENECNPGNQCQYGIDSAPSTGFYSFDNTVSSVFNCSASRTSGSAIQFVSMRVSKACQ